MTWAGQGPADVQKDMWQGGQLRAFPSVWRRAAKNNTSNKLATVRSEVPSFEEAALGDVPGPTTSSVTGQTERNVWGSLFNDLLKTGGEAFQVSQQTELAKAQAANQSRFFGTFPNINLMQGGGMGILGWTLIAAGLGTIGYIVMRNR